MITIEEEDVRFSILNSTIPNAGRGLFAKIHIAKGSTLEIIGAFVKKGSIADTCTDYAKRYKFYGSKMDAYIVPFGFAGIVNHTKDKNLQNVEIRFLKNYNKRSQHSSDVVYYFLRDIAPGEEIFGFYGNQWDGELDKISDNINNYENNKDEWNKFLEFDLYNLKSLCQLMS